MKVIQNGESQTDTYKGQTVRGILVQMYAQGKTNNQALTSTDFQFRNTSITLTLTKSGSSKPITILSTTFDVFIKLANFMKAPVKKWWAINVSLFSAVPDPVGTMLFDGVLQSTSAALPDIRLIGGKLEFPCVINLRGDDRLDLTVNYAPGTIVATGNASSTSYIQMSQVVGHGEAHGIPFYDILPIQQNQSNVNIPAGDGIEKVYFINTDRIDSTIANSVIQNMGVQSREKSETLQYNEILGHRSNQFPFFWADYQYGDFLLFDRRASCGHGFIEDDIEGANEVNININLNTANVTASNNYAVSIGVKSSSADFAHYMSTKSMNSANRMLQHGMLNSSQYSSHTAALRPFIRR